MSGWRGKGGSVARGFGEGQVEQTREALVELDRIVEVRGPGTFAQSLAAAGTCHAEIALVGRSGPALDLTDLENFGKVVIATA
ncbi:hypothetical protein [Amycolatopsis sp. cmx-4-61]|uniref:hypothetical protein n=1 Tax=Amycolatopsis sp. cmx-4-61 TaxID=2790937 RepID=UPI00397B0BFC